MGQSLFPASRAGWNNCLAAWLLLAVRPALQQPEGDASASPLVAWRILNADEVEVAWRIRNIQFFSDIACSRPVLAESGVSGTAFASNASEMTGAEYAFALRSPRGWESEDFCAPNECHLGFSFVKESVDVKCVLLSQGEAGFHATALTLQVRHQGQANEEWADVITWRPVQPGKAKLAISCPEVPSVTNGVISDCHLDDARSGTCAFECNTGYGTVEPALRCIHGVWYIPECLAVGSILRVVAQEPELIKPYWVVLDASLFASPDCTDALKADGMAVSSGEFIIKYANYHPRNVWDNDAGTSWASSTPCTPGSCYFGIRFHELPTAPVRCVRIEHPHGRQYQATKVSVEVLGRAGWDELQGVGVQLLPDSNEEL